MTATPEAAIPIWARPALLLRRIHPALAASVRPDLDFLRKIDPRLPLALPAVALAVTVVFSLLRLTIDQVYTESLVFLILAVAVGLLSPAAGVLLVLLHAVFDLARALTDPFASFGAYGPVGVVAGRLVSVYLLWLLVVEVGLLARTIPWSVMTGERPAAVATRRLVAIGSAGVAVGVVVWVWTQAASILVRPVFTWGGQGSPSTVAIFTVQESGMFLVFGAAAAAAVVAFLRLRSAAVERAGEVTFEEPEDFDLDQYEGEPEGGFGFVGDVARHMVAVFMLGGLITGFLDLVILGGVALASQPVAERLLKIPAIRTLLAPIPWIVRFLVGFGLTFAVGVVVNTIRYEPLAGSEFFPLVVTVAFGLIIFQVVLTDPDDEDEAPVPATPAASSPPAADGSPSGGVIGAVLVGLTLGSLAQLAFPGTALADNCSGLFDCYISGVGAASAAAAAAAVAAAAATQRNRRIRRRKRRPPAEPPALPPPPPTPPAMEPPSDQQPVPDPPPPSDEHPVPPPPPPSDEQQPLPPPSDDIPRLIVPPSTYSPPPPPQAADDARADRSDEVDTDRTPG